jgi:4-diphosphocytidyl-2-C-methyl-D-erythritol kinase
VGTEAPAESLLFNGLETVVFRKFIALPTLLRRLRDRFGLAPLMSGSGSACFMLLPESAPIETIAASIREAWGPVCFVQATTIA